MAGQHEDTGADDAADAERHQVERTECPPELTALEFRHDLCDRLPYEKARHLVTPSRRGFACEPRGRLPARPAAEGRKVLRLPAFAARRCNRHDARIAGDAPLDDLPLPTRLHGEARTRGRAGARARARLDRAGD